MRARASTRLRGTFAPAVGFAHLVARNQTAATPPAHQLAPVITDAPLARRADDLAILDHPGYVPTHQAVELDAYRWLPTKWTWFWCGSSHARPAYRRVALPTRGGPLYTRVIDNCHALNSELAHFVL